MKTAKELARQVPGWNCNGVFLGPYEKSLEQFAELLKQECIKAMRARLFPGDNLNPNQVAHNNAIWCCISDLEYD
jgi:hypothetical protein